MIERIPHTSLRAGIAAVIMTVCLTGGCESTDLTTHEGRAEMIGEGIGQMLPVDFGISAKVAKSIGKSLDEADGATPQQRQADKKHEEEQRALDREQYRQLQKSDPEKYAKLQGKPKPASQ